MEEHPIPQNVTQFEFHLVGDMTLKQFGYLAAGLTCAYVTFLVLSTSVPFLAYPLIFVFAMTGIAFAFLPISERPLDHWVKAYINAIFSPTQRVYRSEVLPIDNPYYQDRLALYLDTFEGADQGVKLAPRLSSVSQMAPATQQVVAPAPVIQPQIVPPAQTAPVQPVPPQPAPKEEEPTEDLNKVVEYAKEAQIIQTEIMETEKELTKIKVEAAQPGHDPKEFTKNFQLVLSRLQNLNNQASAVSKQLADLTKTPSQSSESPVKIVSAETKPTEKYVVLTETANIINGVVTDATGNYLEGVVVVVDNKEGLPVRALKTNKLGQFLAATPLQNGTYTITLEKDNLNFDVLQIELSGEVLPAVRISAKRGGG